MATTGESGYSQRDGYNWGASGYNWGSEGYNWEARATTEAAEPTTEVTEPTTGWQSLQRVAQPTTGGTAAYNRDEETQRGRELVFYAPQRPQTGRRKPHGRSLACRTNGRTDGCGWAPTSATHVPDCWTRVDAVPHDVPAAASCASYACAWDACLEVLPVAVDTSVS